MNKVALDFRVRAVVLAFMLGMSPLCVRVQAEDTTTTSPPIDNSKPIDRETRDISGWQVHIARKLLENEADDTEKAIQGLKKMLDEIVRDVPAEAVAEPHIRMAWERLSAGAPLMAEAA